MPIKAVVPLFLQRRKLSLPLLFLCLLLGTAVAVASGSRSSVRAGAPLPTAHDAFVDPNNPTTSYNAERLELAFSNFPSFVPTRRSLLQFDLTGITADLTAAHLTLTLVENNVNSDARVTLALYAAEDAWTETTVTWDTRPLQTTLVQTMTVAAGYTGTITFNTAAVGSFLENEQSADQVASFYLLLTDGDGALGFGGNLFFEDREGSADGLNGNEPTILLPDSTPTPTVTTTVPAAPSSTLTPTATALMSPSVTPTATATSATPMASPTTAATVTPSPSATDALFLPLITNQ